MANTTKAHEQVTEFLDALKKKPSSALLTDPIKLVLNNKKSENLILEIASLQILLAVKTENEKILDRNFGLELKPLKTKLARTYVKSFYDMVFEVIDILSKLKTTSNEDLKVLNILKDSFILAQQGTVIKKEELKEYENEHLKEVLSQFEANQSIVYLLNLVNRVYLEELPIGRVNRVLGAFEILATIKEIGANKIIEFGKMTLDELRIKMKGSLTNELLNICYQAVLALNERVEEINEMTPALLAKIKQIKSRFENIVKENKES